VQEGFPRGTPFPWLQDPGVRASATSVPRPADARTPGKHDRPYGGRGAAAAGGAGRSRREAARPVDRQHRPRQRADALQRDPAGSRRPHAHLRRLARRALPRDRRHQLRNRDLAGGTGEAQARAARRARGPERRRRPRRRAASGRRRGGRCRRPRAARPRRPGAGRRRSRRERRPRARRVDPDRRVPRHPAPERRGGAVGELRPRGLRRLPRHRCRRGRVRGADRGHGARVPPSPFAPRAPGQPSALRAGRRHDPAGRDPRRRARAAGRQHPPRGRDRRRGHGLARPRGPRPPRLADVRRRRRPPHRARSSRAAAERDRVACLGRHPLHRQDRDADRREDPCRRRRAVRRRRPGDCRGGARPLRLVEPGTERDRRGSGRCVPCRGRAAGGGGAVLVASALERRAAWSEGDRPRRARALPPRRPLGAGQAGSGGRPAGRGRGNVDRPAAHRSRGRASAGPSARRCRPRRGVAPRRGRDRRVPRRRGRRGQGPVGRRPGDRPLDRP